MCWLLSWRFPCVYLVVVHASRHARARIPNARWQALALDLIQKHYDPRYEKQRARVTAGIVTSFATDSLEAPYLDDLAARIEQTLESL